MNSEHRLLELLHVQPPHLLRRNLWRPLDLQYVRHQLRLPHLHGLGLGRMDLLHLRAFGGLLRGPPPELHVHPSSTHSRYKLFVSPQDLLSFGLSMLGREIVFSDTTLTVLNQGASRFIGFFGNNYVTIDKDENGRRGRPRARRSAARRHLFLTCSGREGRSRQSPPATSRMSRSPHPARLPHQLPDRQCRHRRPALAGQSTNAVSPDPNPAPRRSPAGCRCRLPSTSTWQIRPPPSGSRPRVRLGDRPGVQED